MPQENRLQHTVPRFSHNGDVIDDHTRTTTARRRPTSSLETFSTPLDLYVRDPSEAAREMAYMVFDLEPHFREWVQRKLPISFPPEYEQFSQQFQEMRHQAMQNTAHGQGIGPYPRHTHQEQNVQRNPVVWQQWDGSANASRAKYQRREFR